MRPLTLEAFYCKGNMRHYILLLARQKRVHESIHSDHDEEKPPILIESVRLEIAWELETKMGRVRLLQGQSHFCGLHVYAFNLFVYCTVYRPPEFRRE